LKRAAGIAPSHTGGDPLPRLKGVLVCPRHLDPIGRREFKRIVMLLKKSKTLSRTDGPLIVIYASTYSTWMAAEAEIEERGLLIETFSGDSKVNPAANLAESCKRTMLRILVQLGLSPNARERAAPLSAVTENYAAAKKTAAVFLKINPERQPG
jgi:P27 family predicted phage terminase small subunit